MDESDEHAPAARGVVRLPAGSIRVTDADEEVFLLYTGLAARTAADGSSGFRGLGHIDSHEDTLTVTLNLGIPENADAPDDMTGAGKRKARGSQSKKARSKKDAAERTLEVEIVQDKTALRSRKGDTGSVLWHASVDFAQTVLRQLYGGDAKSLLVPELLKQAHVVELGAGTGLLAVVLSPFVHHYTVTDIHDLVPLIRKNIARNPPLPPTSPRSKGARLPPSATASNVTAAALDWIEIRNATPALRQKLAPSAPAGLVLVVDCIYHPSLIPPLLSTIDYLAVPGKTAVLVVVELRAEDVVREFLQGWLALSPAGEWEIWSIGGLVDGPYAVWVGWRCASSGT
ncbi:Diaminohydroxyphosphoribosylamino-pyrimidine deaminase [Trametes pubescens]|uniref:Diaminohydroxyphosphoribosylamino-pyrimidine deaminase n=1 Tax=Trametes pubescens TaxID=154538 RepID=A0A1M2VBT9_TRAPU|nr:Diaminohydroxyphosphoribosylamino-pyrimidine deaminase [Trametes pubescens]